MRYGWQLRSDLWEHLSAACANRTWTRTYLEASYSGAVPAAPGIYLICASAKGPLRWPPDEGQAPPLYDAVYVGQATDLRRRFCQHTRGYRNVAKAINIFRRLDYWYTRAIESELDALEERFIEALGPVANDRHVLARIGEPVPAGSLPPPRLSGDDQ
jgi:hypothetical protein